MPRLSPPALLVRVFLVLAAIVAIAASFHYDAATRQAIVDAQGKGWKRSEAAKFQGAISRYGDWPQLMLLGGAGLLVAWRCRSRDWRRILLAAMAASTLAGILANASRLTTGRPRPREIPKIEHAWYGPYHNGQWLIGNSKYNAFPSGHTATAVGFAGVILFARPLAGLLALFGALVVAWSRMQLGAHHLSDVVVATALALFVAWWCWRMARRHGDAIEAWVLARIPRRP